MADAYTISPIPSIGFSFAPIPVISVTVDKTGPAGSGVLDDIARSNIAGHVGDSSNPHGLALVQTSLAVQRATVGVDVGGMVNDSVVVIDFTLGGCHTLTGTGALTFTVTSLAVGQRGSIHILSGTPAPTASFPNVVWIGSPPVFSPTKLTVVTLFNDGVRIIGAAGTQL